MMLLMKKGKLYVVATPIGNLEDITFRAVDILKSVAFVLAEDTRESRKLCERYGIEGNLVSYRDQNHMSMIGKILEKLDMGLDLALISDAGTPLISDPGYKLVRDLRNGGYEVVSIPGASAVVSALCISGLPTDRFIFLGFLPKSEKKRKEILSNYLMLNDTVIVYESPNRVVKLLELVNGVFPKCTAFLAKDISKLHEESFYGPVGNILESLHERNFENSPHGEFVCIFNLSNFNN